MSLRAKLISVPEELTLITEDEDEMYLLDAANDSQALQDWLVQHDCQRGDLVHFTHFGEYRNDGRVICDGRRLVNLDYDIIDYGTIPDSFQVINEFPCDYWLGVHAHNDLISFTPIEAATNPDFYEEWAQTYQSSEDNEGFIMYRDYKIQLYFECGDVINLAEYLRLGKYHAECPDSDCALEPGPKIMWLVI